MNIGMKAAFCAAALFSAVYGFGAVGDYAKPELNIAVAGERSVAVDRPEMQIDVAPQGSLRLETREEDVFVRVQPGGNAVLNGQWDDTSWHGKVALWLDASAEWTLEPETNSAGTVQTVTESGKKGAVIVRWRDRRPEQTEWLGYNDRDTHPNANGMIFPGVMPFVVSNGCNNLNYVSLGKHNSGRRLPFIRTINGVEQTSGGQGGNGAYSLDAMYVMMVFGSQNGGGNAVIAGKRGGASLYPRGSISAAAEPGQSASTSIFSGRRETRLDGSAVDPGSVGFNGGWQVLGFAPNKKVKVGDELLDETVTGIGWSDWGTYGGQNYAEILIFSEMPTELEIKKAELYLAKKWGVSTCRNIEDGKVRLFGSGSAAVEMGSVKLGGMFSGTLSVAGGAEIVLSDENRVPAAPASGMVGWFDPSSDDSRVLEKATVNGVAVDRMKTLVNIAGGAHGSLKFDLISSGRGPAVTSEARGWGAEMTWCDYSTNRLAGISNGTTLRFNSSTDGEDNCLGAKSGFMVLDTSAGGGTPFLDTSVYASSGNVVSRRVTVRNVGSPVFYAKSDSAFVTNSPAYLNGIKIESGTRGYNARPELLSFNFTETMPIRCFGSWQQTQAYTTDPEFELRHGEIILYPDVLPERDRRDTEAYLMAKWLGVSPAGYGDISGMTITGSGTVKAANGSMRPKMAAEFTGRLEIAGGRLAFTVGGAASGTATDAIVMPGGRLATESSLVIDLDFISVPPTGEYTLVDAGEWNAAELTLGALTGEKGSAAAEYKLVRTGSRLVLKVVRPGMRVIVK